MWSLTSPRAKRISGPKKFRSPPQKDFCNTIRHKLPFHNRSFRESFGADYPLASLRSFRDLADRGSASRDQRFRRRSRAKRNRVDPDVVQHEVSVSLGIVGHNGWDTHDKTLPRGVTLGRSRPGFRVRAGFDSGRSDSGDLNGMARARAPGSLLFYFCQLYRVILLVFLLVSGEQTFMAKVAVNLLRLSRKRPQQLYEEGAHRRRMMVISLHDRISGHAGRVRALDRFLSYAKGKEGVWFARKNEIARWALDHRTDTPVIERGSPNVTGLPGPTA
jgi:hypothetical protein